MELVARLLPTGSPLQVEAWALDAAATQVIVRATSTQPVAHCPVCGAATSRIHSQYTRTVADLPWAHRRVVVQLGVRRFFCANRPCLRRIFTERLPHLLAPWARRTTRLAQRLTALAMALGGTAGAQLSQTLGMAVSRNTLLRLLRQQPLPTLPTPTVLGVDDFALRKRQCYGTVLIDLDRHQPVALLPERTAAPVAQWLQDHPGVQVITRDRSTAYAEGAATGAPTAIQVADRFHLLQNLAETLTQVLTMQAPALDAVNAAGRPQPIPLPDGTPTVSVVPLPEPPIPVQERMAARHTRRQAVYDTTWALRRQGWPIPAIAQQVGLSRRTVERDLSTAIFPARKRRSDRGRSLLAPSTRWLIERWNAGCHTAMRLFHDLTQRGYTGSYGRVAAYARRLRQAQGLAPGQRRPHQARPPVAESPVEPLTPRRATWLVLRRARPRTDAETQQLAQLHAQNPEVAEAIDLAQDFATLVRQRQPAALDSWLARAARSPLDAFQRFAAGLRTDYAAVKAGVTLPWSTGPVEGHINRLKMLKRQMFGRAHLDLLSRRFVRVPGRGRGPPVLSHPTARVGDTPSRA